MGCPVLITSRNLQFCCGRAFHFCPIIAIAQAIVQVLSRIPQVLIFCLDPNRSSARVPLRSIMLHGEQESILLQL